MGKKRGRSRQSSGRRTRLETLCAEAMLRCLKQGGSEDAQTAAYYEQRNAIRARAGAVGMEEALSEAESAAHVWGVARAKAIRDAALVVFGSDRGV